MPTDDSPRPESPRPDGSSSTEVTDTSSTPTIGARRDAVREKASQVHAQQSRARVIRRVSLLTGAVAAVAVLGVAVAWAVGAAADKPQMAPPEANGDGFAVTSIAGTTQMAPGDVATPTPAPTETPAAEAAPTPAPTATTTAPVDIHVYVDYLSPLARDWQLANASQLSSWLSEGAATLTYHPVSMLTAKSNGTKYSLRAAGAAACVATFSPASFFAFNDDLLKRQPAVDSDGLSDKELADIAQANGSDQPKKLRECIETEAFSTWVKAATERAIAGADGPPLTGISMVTVNGEAYVGDPTDAAEFSQFVLTTASGKSAKGQSPSPTPSASVTP